MGPIFEMRDFRRGLGVQKGQNVARVFRGYRNSNAILMLTGFFPVLRLAFDPVLRVRSAGTRGGIDPPLGNHIDRNTANWKWIVRYNEVLMEFEGLFAREICGGFQQTHVIRLSFFRRRLHVQAEKVTLPQLRI